MVFTKSPKGSELQSDPEMASHDAALESLGLPRTHQADYIMEGDLAVEDELKADPEERIQWLLLTGRYYCYFMRYCTNSCFYFFAYVLIGLSLAGLGPTLHLQPSPPCSQPSFLGKNLRLVRQLFA